MRLSRLLLVSILWITVADQKETRAMKRSVQGQRSLPRVSKGVWSARSGRRNGLHPRTMAVKRDNPGESAEQAERMALRDLQKLAELQAALNQVTKKGVGADQQERDQQKRQLSHILTTYVQDKKLQKMRSRTKQIVVNFVRDEIQKKQDKGKSVERTSHPFDGLPQRVARDTRKPATTRVRRHSQRKTKPDVLKIVEKTNGEDDNVNDDTDDDDANDDDDDEDDDLINYAERSLKKIMPVLKKGHPKGVQYVPVPVPIHMHKKKPHPHSEKHILNLPPDLIDLMYEARKAKEKAPVVRVIKVEENFKGRRPMAPPVAPAAPVAAPAAAGPPPPAGGPPVGPPPPAGPPPAFG